MLVDVALNKLNRKKKDKPVKIKESDLKKNILF